MFASTVGLCVNKLHGINVGSLGAVSMVGREGGREGGGREGGRREGGREGEVDQYSV